MPYRLLVFSIFVVFLAQAENAYSQGLITDRPDFTESSATVPPIHLQSELGVDYSTLGDENTLTVPNWLLRFGLFPFLELRLGIPSYQASFAGDAVGHDVGGIEFGAKAAIGIGGIFAMGILPYMIVPIRGPHYDAGNFEAGVKFTWALALGRIISLSGNFGVFGQGIAAPVDPSPGYLASLSLGIGITRRFGMFAELYTISDGNEHFRPIADGGFTFLITPRFQLDAYFGVGLSEASRGINPGAGMSFIL